MRTVALISLLAATTALGGCVIPGPALYMAGEQHELEQQMAGTPVKVVRKGDVIILRMPSDVTFAVDKADIDPGFLPVLATMAEIIARYPDTSVEVTGHADSTGTDAHNQALSERRAASVGSFFASKGVTRGRLAMSGEGENAPIASNDTEEGRAENRRVEVELQPIHRPPANSIARSDVAPPPF